MLYSYSLSLLSFANASRLYGWTRPTMCDEIVIDVSQGRYMASSEVLFVFSDHTIGTLSRSWSTIDSCRMTHTLWGAVASAFRHKLAPAQVQIWTKLRKTRLHWRRMNVVLSYARVPMRLGRAFTSSKLRSYALWLRYEFINPPHACDLIWGQIGW